MIVRIELFRSKNNEFMGDHNIQINISEAFVDKGIEENKFINGIVETLQNVLTDYVEKLDEVKKYGIGYIGEMRITHLIFKKRELTLTEESIRNEFKQKMPNINVLFVE